MPLPNFLVIGAAKAGTTSLHHYLRQHPDIDMPALNEARYARYEEASDPSVQIQSAAEYARLFDGVVGDRRIRFRLRSVAGFASSCDDIVQTVVWSALI